MNHWIEMTNCRHETVDYLSGLTWYSSSHKYLSDREIVLCRERIKAPAQIRALIQHNQPQYR